MRELIAAILSIIILAFIAVFSAEIFYKLFIEADNNFTNSASAAFLGAFLAFIFVRIGDFFKSYSDRTSKSYNALIKLEHTLNGLLTSLDDNVYIIETFENIYKNYIEKANNTHVFLWANKLHPVTRIDELILELLNINLINELFALNIHLRKLNDSMDTINCAYIESKEALISKNIDAENYLTNLENVHKNLLDIKQFLLSYIEETVQALASVRVLAKQRPLIGSILRKLPGNKYGSNFNTLRSEELIKLRKEMETTKNDSQVKINKALNQKP